MKNQFGSNIVKIGVIFFIIFFIVMGVFYTKTFQNASDQTRNQIVALNEVEKLAEEGNHSEELHHTIEELQSSLAAESREENHGNERLFLLVTSVVVIVFIVILFVYIYVTVIRPFKKLNHFAAEISKGNMDIPLVYERNNLFGSFTWAFDSMRREIKKARSCEKEAIENNKTTIATISHDIKTPIASIRAYSEALQAGMDNNIERRERYISVIISKCDEVSRLTNDLFLHSLADLEKLEMHFEEYDSRKLITRIISGVQVDNKLVDISMDIPEAVIAVDARRLEQVYENLIENAIKYAGNGKIEITHAINEEYLTTVIRDYGNGIDNEDLPFIFEKFYRGKNTNDKPGAGLGLYIAHYIMEQMNGKIELQNRVDGLEAIIYINRNKIS